MSDSDRERRQRRRRGQSARTVRSDDIHDRNRLRTTELLSAQSPPIAATQTRHTDNSQHLQNLNRKLEVNRRKEARRAKKENERVKRQVEEVHQTKLNELTLYNDPNLIQKLIKDHLKKSTEQGPLDRIDQSEEEVRHLKEKHDQLLKLVHRNQLKCDQNKREHDHEIEETRQRFEDYRLEIDQYIRHTANIIADLEGKLKRLNERQDLLNEKQKEYGITIENLSLQRETLDKLSFQIEQIINARRADLNKLDQFTKKLDDVRDLLNQERHRFQVLNHITSLEREIQEIRNLFIDTKKFQGLESRVRQVEGLAGHHNDELRRMKEQLDTFESIYRSLKDTIDSINNDLRKMNEQIQTITNDFNRKTSEISEANGLSRSTLKQVKELRQLLDTMNKKFSSFDNPIQDIADIMSRLENLENKPDDPRIQAALDDLMAKFQELLGLANALENLRRRVEDLEKPVITNNETDHRNEKDFEDFLQKVKGETIDPIFNLMQQINGQINNAKTLINELRTQLNAEPPPYVQPSVSLKVKLIPYIESLPPIDLLDNIWTSEIHSDY